MTYIKLGGVRAFPGVKPTKAQALKVLEEASEVHGAWESTINCDRMCTECSHTPRPRLCVSRKRMLDELADTIQACANLASALGVTDITPYLAACEEKNRKRGRYE